MVLGNHQPNGSIDFNAQTRNLQESITQGDSLCTRRSGVLAQIFFCEGCCCGRTDKGFPPLPRELIKEHWKKGKLNQTIQLTISGCLGPCDLANVFYLLAADGTGQWYGGLSEPWQYQTLIQWATDCQQAEFLLPIPGRFAPYRFERFQPQLNGPLPCSLAAPLATQSVTIEPPKDPHNSSVT